MTFHAFNICPQLLENIRRLHFETPTPIQREVIPAVAAGRDVIGLAQTGTGKTAAFAIPLLHRLIEHPRRQLRVLVIGPTRELAEQTKEAFLAMGKNTGIQVATVYGGVGMGPQIKKLQQGVEIVVGCPGRLLDHLRRGTLRLNSVEVVVLDEADRMFDMGFIPDVRKLMAQLPPKRQTLFFSATMPSAIRRLVHEFLKDPLTFEIAHARPAQTVAHAIYPIVQHLKCPLLLSLLSQIERESVLIFTRTKQRAQRLTDQLKAHGHKVACLQGDLTQRHRQAAMDGFRKGLYQIMVATDLAARGLDVASISHVINYDMPATVDDYTHRIGRTGRAAKTGDAFTLVTFEDEGLVRDVEKVLGEPIERRQVPGFDYTTHVVHRPPAPALQKPQAQTPAPTGLRPPVLKSRRRRIRFH